MWTIFLFSSRSPDEAWSGFCYLISFKVTLKWSKVNNILEVIFLFRQDWWRDVKTSWHLNSKEKGSWQKNTIHNANRTNVRHQCSITSVPCGNSFHKFDKSLTPWTSMLSHHGQSQNTVSCHVGYFGSIAHAWTTTPTSRKISYSAVLARGTWQPKASCTRLWSPLGGRVHHKLYKV